MLDKDFLSSLFHLKQRAINIYNFELPSRQKHCSTNIIHNLSAGAPDKYLFKTKRCTVNYQHQYSKMNTFRRRDPWQQGAASDPQRNGWPTTGYPTIPQPGFGPVRPSQPWEAQSAWFNPYEPLRNYHTGPHPITNPLEFRNYYRNIFMLKNSALHQIPGPTPDYLEHERIAAIAGGVPPPKVPSPKPPTEEAVPNPDQGLEPAIVHITWGLHAAFFIGLYLSDSRLAMELIAGILLLIWAGYITWDAWRWRDVDPKKLAEITHSVSMPEPEAPAPADPMINRPPVYVD
jgi:hypothetical protein